MKQRVGIGARVCNPAEDAAARRAFRRLDALTRGVIQDELLKICAATRQTVFMITHDVDEALLLADRILLMSNGPRAVIRRDREERDGCAPGTAQHSTAIPSTIRSAITWSISW